MAWGSGGEELREQARIELALIRRHVYRMSELADGLRHPEKGPQLRALAERFRPIVDEIEALLNR